MQNERMYLLFVCLGNICRSPMAEFLAKDACKKAQINAQITSAGTSGWHDGEDMHEGTKARLKALGIDASGFCSSRLSAQEAKRASAICVMDDANARDVAAAHPECAHKILQLGHLGGFKEVADPWYTQDFARTQRELEAAISALVREILAGANWLERAQQTAAQNAQMIAKKAAK